MAVDGGPVGDPATLEDRLRSRIGGTVTLTLESADGGSRTVEVRPRAVTWRDDETAGIGSPLSIPSLGLAIPVQATVAAVTPGSPAAEAGIVAGDRIVRAVIVEPGEEADPKAGTRARAAAYHSGGKGIAPQCSTTR